VDVFIAVIEYVQVVQTSFLQDDRTAIISNKYIFLMLFLFIG